MIEPSSMPRPASPLYVIGDIHGRIDLLDEMLGQIDADMTRHPLPPDERGQLVFLGDYIDRTADGGAVIDLLQDLQQAAPDDAICLMGNHERMLLDVLDAPQEHAFRWLRHGGEETLAGLGLTDPDAGSIGAETPPEAAARLAERLRDALSETTQGWLRDLPLWHRNGDVICVHAAMDPDASPEEQEAKTMLWDGCRRFHTQARRDGLWVVHGHSIVPDPIIHKRRIAIDTGAYYSDRLTAAVLYPDQPIRFLQTGP
ncbi:metallophosphoesterase family protein [Jannaschia sp. 2305UL9-9]|uniref:metallophosphoesterase family protein n=1 Tax=Jannaschia sp. 2305UL9-9 TaxID=3121638 RepID=UPI003528ACDD